MKDKEIEGSQRVLELSADGKFLILKNGSEVDCSLLFDVETFELKQKVPVCAYDVLDDTLIYKKKDRVFFKPLDKPKQNGKEFEIDKKINDKSAKLYRQAGRFVKHEGKFYSFVLAKLDNGEMKAYRFQFGNNGAADIKLLGQIKKETRFELEFSVISHNIFSFKMLKENISCFVSFQEEEGASFKFSSASTALSNQLSEGAFVVFEQEKNKKLAIF